MVNRSSRTSSPRRPHRRARRGRSLLGLVRVEKVLGKSGRNRVRLRFHWGRIAATLALLTVVGWVSVAGALTLYFREVRDYREASFGKMMLLPFRMEDHRREMGEFFVQEGIASAEEGDYRAAFHELRIGLARAPALPEGRRLLAEIYALGLRDNALALEVLQGGLEYRDEDPGFLGEDYLRPLFLLLARERADEERIALAGELRAEAPDEATATFLTTEAVRAKIARGHYEEALRQLRETGLWDTLPGRLTLAEMHGRRGEDERAVAILLQAAERYPGREDIGQALLRASRAAGRWDDLHAYARYQQIFFPEQVGPRVLELHALEGRGERAKATERAGTLLAERGDEAAVQLALLRFAADSRRADLANRVVARAEPGGTLLPSRTLLLALSRIRAGEYDSALALLETVQEKREAEEDLGPVPDPARLSALEAVARIGKGETDAARAALARFYRQPSTPPALFLTLANLFSEAGSDALAYEVLLEGAERSPGQLDLLSALLRHDEQAQRNRSFLAHAQRILDRQVPGPDLLRRIRTVLSSDRFLLHPERPATLARVDELLAETELPASLVAAVPVEDPDREGLRPPVRDPRTTPLGLPRVRPGILAESSDPLSPRQ